MAKSWKDLSLDEAVARAKTISRQALHIAINTYTKNGRVEIVEQLRQVRKELKRDNRISKIGLDKVVQKEVKCQQRALRIKEFEASGAVPAKGFEGSWSVTRDGRVWSHVQDRWLKQSTRKNGNNAFRIVNGAKGVAYVHRLVARAFVPNPGKRKPVFHIDGDTTNNHYTNLIWGMKKPKLDK